MKEEGSTEHKIDIASEDKQNNQDEKEKDTKEDISQADNNGADSEQKQDEEKTEKTDAEEVEEKPEEVAIEVADSVAVPLEKGSKNETLTITSTTGLVYHEQYKGW